MLTHEELAQIAARALGNEEVNQFILDDQFENLICFEEGGPEVSWSTLTKEEVKVYLDTYVNRFVIVDSLTGKEILYTMGIDIQHDVAEARANFFTGLQSQKYRLEIFDIRDWERTRQVLQGIKLDMNALIPPLKELQKTSNWLRVDLTPFQERHQQDNKLVFNNVDINGYYLALFGGRYYNCLDFILFNYDDTTQTVIGRTVVQDDVWTDEFDNSFGEDGEEFWDQLYIGPSED